MCFPVPTLSRGAGLRKYAFQAHRSFGTAAMDTTFKNQTTTRTTSTQSSSPVNRGGIAASTWRGRDDGNASKKGNSTGRDNTVKTTSGSNAKIMLTPRQTQSLQSDGHELIGSHSSVKMCRWTKNAMKKQGMCYKHTFYGINSHQCMEMTPSLACANRCTFCWRNHSNPVTMKWNYDADDPDFIVNEALNLHQKKFIRQVAIGPSPTLDHERAEQAKQVRHCALSLVGEPVIYPHLNELLQNLHSRRVSTFLVTNGQFPDELEKVERVTQLYCSVDAPTEEQLNAIGKPLFKDAFARLEQSLDILRTKRDTMRTVCRMTLLNVGHDAEKYARLIERAMPDFIEIKGATFAPKVFGPASLEMKHIPTHTEVKHCALAMEHYLPAYSIAAEHHHSCAMLLARRDRYYYKDGWNTWIDFEGFHDGLGPDEAQRPTPEFALFGSKERGFLPSDVQKERKRKRPDDE